MCMTSIDVLLRYLFRARVLNIAFTTAYEQYDSLRGSLSCNFEVAMVSFQGKPSDKGDFTTATTSQ
jgi:hypothetical protein